MLANSLTRGVRPGGRPTEVCTPVSHPHVEVPLVCAEMSDYWVTLEAFQDLCLFRFEFGWINDTSISKLPESTQFFKRVNLFR